MCKKYSLLLICCLLSIITTHAQNLIINGDFESGGNGVGFNINSCCYNELTPPFTGSTFTGNYAVTNNPQAMNTAFFAGGDHTTGTGNMLVIDGTTTAGNQRFWRAGNNGGGICNLTVGTTYTFSYWIKSLSVQNRANIGYEFVGASNVTLLSGNSLAPLPAEGWQQVTYTFIPTNTCVNFELWNTTTIDIGNDFAIDDVSLTGPPLPFSAIYSSANPSCSTNSDGFIVGYGTGGNPPYVYILNGPVNGINNSGVFSQLPAGNYTLQVLEGADGQITINNIILSNPPNLTLNPTTSICIGAETTLTVSGSSTGYTWTASPTDDSLLQPNSANPIVSPIQTTTYTVTATSSSNRNLIFNGDFSAGNIGFQTDYRYYNPGSSNGAQKAYGIINNANTWSSFFSNCTDHTSGTGNMMVVDGSNVNSGNDKLWCQTIAVNQNQNYTFEYWVQTVALPIPANIAVVINGETIGTQTAPANTCNWQLRSYVWNSGANTTAQICIYDRTTAATGNDFAIDDLSFEGPVAVCNLSNSVTITVDPKTVPDFPTNTVLCNGITAPNLPATSPNGITGIWTPAVVNNTVSGVYTFQPDPNQCATSTTFQVSINNALTPTFNITNPICAGTTLSPLPTTSLNNIVGFWTPAFDNTTTTIYTFNPAPDQCGGGTTFELIVTPTTTPTFSSVGPFCAGKVISDPLPILSSNGIFGSWTPMFNNTETTTYTFTPDPNQCATATTLEVVIIPANIIPTFNFGNTITSCLQPIGEVPPIALPSTSDNGIPGYWSPPSINYSVLGESVYTFTPIVNTCASNFVLTVNIIEAPEFTVNASCIDGDFVLSVTLFEIKEKSNFTWYNEQNEIISTDDSVIISTKGKYKVIKEVNGCNKEQIVDVISVNCKIPKGISPNTDDLNDFFDLSNLKVKQLQIFNRYGTEVYSKSNYKKEWDGRTNNGKELPDGTYYYVIHFETGKSKTGWVYINK
jgi:gliding motility-associated-like protein